MLKLEDHKAENNTLPQVAMFQMITGYWISKSIYVAAKLGIADLLQHSPTSYEQLAQATKTDARAVYRLLRALSSVGIFVEEQPGYFANTSLGALLQTEFPGTLRSTAIALVEEQFQAWGNFLYSIETGKNAFEHIYGMPIFQYYMEHPEQFKIFDAAMSDSHKIKDSAVLASYDFSKIRKLADIGGGKGGLIAAVLKTHPSMEGILFDLPNSIASAQSLVKELDERLQCESGDFFTSVPVGADAYILKRIIHDWDDEQALVILRNCRNAMAPSAKLLVIESVIPQGNEFCPAKFLDLHMLAVTGGMERTLAEYQNLLAVCGFEFVQIISTQVGIDIIEAIAV